MWSIARSYGVRAGLIGLFAGLILTVGALTIDQPSWYWRIVTLANYLFPLHRVLVFAPDTPRYYIFLGYFLAFCVNALFYGVVGLLVGILRALVFGSSISNRIRHP